VTAVLNGDPNVGLSSLTITLRANEGFFFPNGKEITSTTFTVDIMMNFVKKSIPSFPVTVSDLTTNLQSGTTVGKYFTGDLHMVGNLTVRVDGVAAVGHQTGIIIRANDGFIFGSGGKEIISNKINVSAG
ncbi:MAG: hypothetical protein ACRCXE_03080, partial [Metamycoplasmataceae bacterium]